MSNPSSRIIGRHRFLGLSAIVVAGGAIGLAFVVSDDAVAGPGEDLAAESPTLHVEAIPSAEDLFEG